MIMERVFSILREIRPEITKETTGLISDDILDSIDVVLLVNRLSESYDIDIPTDEINTSNFDSAKRISEYVKTRLK